MVLGFSREELPSDSQMSVLAAAMSPVSIFTGALATPLVTNMEIAPFDCCLTEREGSEASGAAVWNPTIAGSQFKPCTQLVTGIVPKNRQQVLTQVSNSGEVFILELTCFRAEMDGSRTAERPPIYPGYLIAALPARQANLNLPK